MANIRLTGYKIVIDDPSQLTLDEAESIIETIDRGLWDTSHGVLRDNVSSIRHDLQGAGTLTDDLRQRVLATVKRFNALKAESLNRALLDDKSLDKGDEKSESVPSSDKGKDSNSNQEERSSTRVQQSSGASIDEIAGLFDTKLQPIVDALPKGEDGKFVQVAAKSHADALQNEMEQVKSDLAKLKKSSQANGPLRWGMALIIGAVAGVIYLVVFGPIWGWSAMLGFAPVFAIVITIVAAIFLPKKQTSPRPTNQPRS